MTPHLRNHVRGYVDRALPPAVLHLYDRHLIACVTCRAAVDQERRIMASLRIDTGYVPDPLRSSLMGLASAVPAAPVREPRRHPGPRIPLGPLAARGPRASKDAASNEPLATRGSARGLAVRAGAPRGMPFATPGGVADALAPVPTVPPTAPPLHRSPMRAAVVASLAAGASVAAAWGLAVSPLPGGVRAPVAGIPSGVASFGAVNYSSGLPSLSTPRAEATRLGTGRFGGVAGARSFWLVSSTPGIVMQGVPASSVRISVVTSAQSRP